MLVTIPEQTCSAKTIDAELHPQTLTGRFDIKVDAMLIVMGASDSPDYFHSSSGLVMTRTH
jgi:hypothetical protein